MACDTLGRPIRFLIAPGQSHDILAVPALLEGHRPKAVLADRAYDANSFRACLAGIQAEAVIPTTTSRKKPIPYDLVAYRQRNTVERLWARLKDYRRVATRYDKLADNFLSGVLIAAVISYWAK